VDVDGELEEGKIVSSNSLYSRSPGKDAGAIPLQLGIARDRKDDIEQKLRQESGLMCSSPLPAFPWGIMIWSRSLEGSGDGNGFLKVAMKPGKPLAFGTIGGKPAFGLPGNPVSSMVSFEQFVRPSLLKMMGHHQIFRPTIEAVLKRISRRARETSLHPGSCIVRQGSLLCHHHRRPGIGHADIDGEGKRAGYHP